MNTKQLIDFSALAFILCYFVVILVQLLTTNSFYINHLHFILAWVSLSFTALSSVNRTTVHCLAFSAITSNLLLIVAELSGAEVSGETKAVFVFYFVVCWALAVSCRIFDWLQQSGANKQSQRVVDSESLL